MKVNSYEMLHCHTSSSDGKLNHSEILGLCEGINIGYVCFSDHDAVMDLKNFNKLRRCNSKVNWISGIEISSTGPHIVGLFINPEDPDILKHCESAQKARVERMRMMVENLKGLGFSITDEDCLRASKGEAVGRPHIIEALLGYKKNWNIILKLKQEMFNDSLKDPNLKKKYEDMIKRGEEDYPYFLFLDENSYIKGVYVNTLYEISVEDSTKLIRKAGGISILAHWFTDKRKIGYDNLEKMLADNVIDGIETVYGLGVLSKKTMLSQHKRLKELVERYSKIESGGSDAHSREDFKLFAENKWFAEMTIGMTEKILKYSKADINNSSFIK